jgi:hypothetical protein
MDKQSNNAPPRPAPTLAQVVQLCSMLLFTGINIYYLCKKRHVPHIEPSECNDDELACLDLLNRGEVINLEATNDFGNQVAGHVREKLRTLKGILLKPLIKRKHFFRELNVYNCMAQMGNHWTQSGKSFVANFKGVFCAKYLHARSTPPTSGSSGAAQAIIDEYQLYLGIEDLTANLVRPCAIDVKMGTQTYEPGADDTKKRREIRKCPYQAEVGFRITGFRAYDVRTDGYRAVSKHFGRRLLPDVAHEALALFFFDGVRIRRDVILIVIQKLENILMWMKSQTHYHFFCSSLLIVYDGYVNLEYSRKHFSPGSTHFLENLGPQFPTTHLSAEEDESNDCDEDSAEPIAKGLDASATSHADSHSRPSTSASASASASSARSAAPSSPKKGSMHPHGNQTVNPAQQSRRKKTPVAALESQVQVKMIDFAHCIPGTGELDAGYLHGLHSLIARLHRVALTHYSVKHLTR